MNESKQDKVFLCRCEEVTQEEIEEAIRDGATTLTGIKKRTHAGMGLCHKNVPTLDCTTAPGKKISGSDSSTHLSTSGANGED